MPHGKFMIEVELEDADYCNGCLALNWTGKQPISSGWKCRNKHTIYNPEGQLDVFRPDTCKANDIQDDGDCLLCYGTGYIRDFFDGACPLCNPTDEDRAYIKAHYK